MDAITLSSELLKTAQAIRDIVGREGLEDPDILAQFYQRLEELERAAGAVALVSQRS